MSDTGAMQKFASNPSLSWLVKTFGVRRAFELCMQFGCTRVYVPSRGPVAPNSGATGTDFTTALTKDELVRFAERWGGCYIKLPIARAFCCRFLAEVEGLGPAEIARRVRMKEDSVRKALTRQDITFNFAPAKAEAARNRSSEKETIR